MRPGARPPRFTRRGILSILALGLLVGVSYYPATRAGFVWDDEIITGAEPVRSLSGLQSIWFSPRDIGREGHYWPLLYTTFWLEHKLWGFAPAGYHVVNVLLHLANTLLLHHLLRRLAAPGAWLAAAVFAAHPLHVESVAWVIERKDLLSGLLYLAAALAYMRFVEDPGPRRYALALALFAAAMLSKSIAVTLPAALLIWHWWKQGRVGAGDLRRLLPLLAVGLGMALADLAFYRSMEPLALGYSAAERLLIACRALWFYVGKLLWPVDLAVIYPPWEIRAADPRAWSYVLAAAAVPVLLHRFRRRVGRGPLAGALFFGVTLSPVLGFVDYGYMQYAFVADRFQYLAGIGVIAVAAGAWTRASGWLPGAVRAGMAGGVVVALGVLTWRQAGIWRDDVTLNRHILSHNPGARGAHHNLGKGLFEQGRLEESVAATRTAIERHRGPVDQRYMEARVNLGLALLHLGRLEEAERHLREVAGLDPAHVKAHINLGRVLLDQGRAEESIAASRAALQQRPGSVEAHVNLGAALLDLGRRREAEQQLRRALEHNPGHASILQNLAEALRMQGRYEEALERYAAVIAAAPELAMAHAGMGDALFRLGRHAEAVRALDRAMALLPGTPAARALLELRKEASEALGAE